MKKLLLTLSLLALIAPILSIQSVQGMTKEEAARKEKINAEFLEAAKDNNVARVKDLIAQGVDINAKDKNGRSALIWASSLGNADVVKLLLDHKQPLETMLSMRKGHESYLSLLPNELIEEVSKYGTDVNAKDNDGLTALMLASELGYTVEIVKLLIKAPGIDVNAKSNSNERSALSMASMNGNTEAVKLLLTIPGIDVNTRGKDGHTPLSFASMNANSEIVKLLLAIPGIDVNARGKDGNTALRFASMNGHAGVVKLLLAHKSQKSPADGLEYSINNEDALEVAKTEGIPMYVKLTIEKALAERAKQ